MPTERFEQLSERKKQKIMEAVAEEVRASYTNKLSMTRIARNASVSRASLYTYFVDREDIFSYSLVQAGRSIREANRRYLSENGGDIWNMLEQSLEFQIAMCRANALYRLLYFPGKWKNCIKAGRWEAFREAAQIYEKPMYLSCKNGELKRLDEKEFASLLNMCQASIALCVQDFLLTGEEAAEEEARFREQLAHIKSALCGKKVKLG